VFVSNPAIGNFFNSALPYLTLIGALFFLIGMGYTLRHVLETRGITLLAWFWAVVLFGGILTTSPPANTRLVMTSPAVALFVALGIYQLSNILVRLKFINARGGMVMSIFFCAVLFVQNTVFYFGIYRTTYSFQDANGEFAMEIGIRLQQLGPKYNYYLFGIPRIFAAFPTDVFLAPDMNMVDLTTDSIAAFTLPSDKGAIFAAIPDNLADLQKIAERYPGGKWEQFERIVQPEVLYYAYIYPPDLPH
jgi:hypothetical protein